MKISRHDKELMGITETGKDKYILKGFLDEVVESGYCSKEEVKEAVFKQLEKNKTYIIPVTNQKGAGDYFLARIGGQNYLVANWVGGFADGCEERPVFKITSIRKKKDELLMKEADSNPDSELVKKIYEAVDDYYNEV